MSKTKRHELTGGKRFDPSCRNHVDCPWCKGNRTYNQKRDEEKAKYLEKEFENN